MSTSPRPADPAHVAQLLGILGPQGLLCDPVDMAPYLVDWRGRARGAAFAVLRPADTGEVAAAVAYCARAGIPIAVHGGNTGQCAGTVPSAAGDQVVLSLARMNRIRELDPLNDTVTVEAGCVLARVQEAAERADRLFPLSLGAEGSCQIGGNLSTNAGGTGVLRYGNARDMVLGLEVVLPDGSVWNGLRGLRKDNTGYDLRQLFVGAEGTLGIITAAVLKLYPRPRVRATALAAVRDPAAAVALLGRLRGAAGDRVSGFEIMSRLCVDILLRQIPRFPDPLPERHAWYVLIELTDALAGADLRGALEAGLAAAIEDGTVHDAVIAESEAQAKTLWAMREEIPEANRKEAPWVRHDVSVPVSRIPELIERGTLALRERFPGVRVIAFGHIGDGNIHFNATGPEGEPPEVFMAAQDEVYDMTHDLVASLGGSFSAEHGIGRLKVGEMARYKSAVELALMRSIKRAIDPAGIMNPGVLLPD